MKKHVKLLIFSALIPFLSAQEKVWRVMPVGDSITEGGSTFTCYRGPLAKMAQEEKMPVKFVGSKSTPSPFGPLAHEGYGGKNSNFLASVVPKNFAKHPADVVLLHACHNQFADQKPIPSVLADHRAMIAAFRKIQPVVIILLAKPIHSGKLPKYAYLPELGNALEDLAKELHSEKQPVILVDHASGFDWKTDAIADYVHPNEKGGTKMAEVWMNALRPIVSPTKK